MQEQPDIPCKITLESDEGKICNGFISSDSSHRTQIFKFMISQLFTVLYGSKITCKILPLVDGDIGHLRMSFWIFRSFHIAISPIAYMFLYPITLFILLTLRRFDSVIVSDKNPFIMFPVIPAAHITSVLLKTSPLLNVSFLPLAKSGFFC